MATAALTALAMLAFAGNSILCRLALGRGLIDASSFTLVRCATGAAMLAVLVLPRHGLPTLRLRDTISAAMLFAYMACFSFAYLSLSAGTGALILFGAVQLTMIAWGSYGGERMRLASWLGFGLALGGLAWLVLPGLSAPDPVGAALMAGAGVAWGIYSLRGRSGGDPLLGTAVNFALATPLALVLIALSLDQADWTTAGILIAAASGTITSGVGYVIWYRALAGLTAMQAASVQLTVPVIAALLGVAFLAESLSLRLFISAVAILGGVGLTLSRRRL